MAECLITGGAGFIGSNLAEYLVRHGHAVRILDNFLTGKRENLRGFAEKLEIIQGDICNAEDCRRAVAGVRYVFHLAALPSVPRSIAEPLRSHDINVTGTLNMLIAARDAGCQRLIFSSSSSVYGDTQALPKQEQLSPEPLSPYGAQKLAAEHYCRVFWKLYGLETVSLRYFNVFGPRQDPQSQYAAVIPRFINAILRDEAPTIFGDGTQTRDFTYVEDVVEANIAAAQASGAALGETINVACGRRFSLLEVLETINATVGKKICPIFAPPRAGDILHSEAAIGKARLLLGWTPRVSFAEGIARTVAWYRRQI
ncbi:MAG: SDR family oxidoreductase [Verrucomicrobiae bacterium]|nr:SDR family oxidoreductase [Verrucomicrobiae bacterium]